MDDSFNTSAPRSMDQAAIEVSALRTAATTRAVSSDRCYTEQSPQKRERTQGLEDFESAVVVTPPFSARKRTDDDGADHSRAQVKRRLDPDYGHPPDDDETAQETQDFPFSQDLTVGDDVDIE
eukprot:scaffold41696_cov107-Amphora_coffeaeformis.AAC.1